jgi:hypothetical protein
MDEKSGLGIDASKLRNPTKQSNYIVAASSQRSSIQYHGPQRSPTPAHINSLLIHVGALHKAYGESTVHFHDECNLIYEHWYMAHE